MDNRDGGHPNFIDDHIDGDAIAAALDASNECGSNHEVQEVEPHTYGPEYRLFRCVGCRVTDLFRAALVYQSMQTE